MLILSMQHFAWIENRIQTISHPDRLSGKFQINFSSPSSPSNSDKILVHKKHTFLSASVTNYSKQNYRQNMLFFNMLQQKNSFRSICCTVNRHRQFDTVHFASVRFRIGSFIRFLLMSLVSILSTTTDNEYRNLSLFILTIGGVQF